MKLYVLGFFVLMGFWSNEQGASLVYDPTNGAQIASLLKTMNDLKDSSEEWKANASFLKKIMDDGQEVKRLFSMLEAMVCATDELQVYIGIEGNAMLCERKLEIDMTLLKIEGISEKVNMIAVGGMVLSQYETVKSLTDLNDSLEEAITKVNNLNQTMRSGFDRWLKQYINKRSVIDDHPTMDNYNI